MSLIIEDEIFQFSTPEGPHSQAKPDNDQLIINKFQYQNQMTNRSFQIVAFHSYRELYKRYLKFIIAFKKRLFNSLDIWYSAKLDQAANYMEENLVVAFNQFPFQIKSYKRKLIALKQINRSKIGQPKFANIYLTEEGSIKIHIPKIVLSQNITTSFRLGRRNVIKSQVFTSYLSNIINFILVDSKQTLKNIFNKLTQVAIKQQNTIRLIQKQNDQSNMKFQLYRYLLRFDCTQGSALYQQVVDITLTQQKQIQDRINHMHQANKLKLSCLELFMQVQDMFKDKSRQAFYMTTKQKQITKNLLQIPQIVPVKQVPGSNSAIIQNKYIFNNIVLQLPRERQSLSLLAESGFGKIQFGVFNFWYLMSSKLQKNDMQQSLKQSNKINNKYLVVKSAKCSQNRQEYRKYHCKQMHEIDIINRLKGLSCGLIPRFYQVEQLYPQAFTQPQHQYIDMYRNALLSQLSSCYGQPGYNVGHLIEERWNILTLKKVVYIMSQVAQALRFLHINKIVHLDLKPQNIVFLRNFSIRLIDYGQAFHPLVPYQDSTPAYTYPYGCPQIAQQSQSFSDKSDTFSFGIILYELLYGRDIFTTKPQNLLQDFIKKDYSKRIYFNPEQLLNYGEDFILPILNHLIIKSLSPDINSRPSITWISVLFKYFLELLY